MNPMKDALAKRRGQGLDIKILIGEPHELEGSDLAPKAAAPAPEMAPEAESEDEAMYGTIMKDMGAHDIESLKSRGPKSLGEHAKMAAMEKMKK